MTQKLTKVPPLLRMRGGSADTRTSTETGSVGPVPKVLLWICAFRRASVKILDKRAPQTVNKEPGSSCFTLTCELVVEGLTPNRPEVQSFRAFSD